MIFDSNNKVTLYEVSRQSGVSIATVSRVINSSPKVKPETRDRVLEVMRQLGFRPSHAARTLAGHQGKSIGVILPDIASGFYAHVLKGIDRALALQGYHAITTFSHDLEDEKALAHRILNERHADALILMNLEIPDAFIDELVQYRVPLVLLDRPSPLRDISSVSINNEQGVMLIMKYLGSRCGYRSVGLLTGPSGTYDADQRLAASLRYAETFGLSISPDRVASGRFEHDGAYEIVTSWIMSDRPLPEALFALNDEMALGAMNACRDHGIRTPEDIGIIGFDDVEYARLIGLTTIHVPLYDMGYQAGELAIAAADPHAKTKNIVLNTSLVERYSCRSVSANLDI